jgi:hypothetical protein
MSPRSCCRLFALAVACAPLTACSSAVRKPQLLHPGPASFQRYNATQFDPYPQNDMGPEMVGARPPDYTLPPDEVKRSRQFLSGAAGSAQQLPAAVPTLPAAPIAAPVYGPAVPVNPPPASVGPAIPAGPPITYRY